jgi:ABC-type glycerol-3-phosphate transport system substrate-binding protein
MCLEETKWGGTYRCIAAIGSVNVLWYNQTLVEQLGLKDPHKTWQDGNWNWNTFEAFVKSVPATTPDGKALNAYGQCGADIPYSWGLTNGIHHIKIDTESKTPNLINNWLDPKTIAAWEFISGVIKSVKYGGGISEVYHGTNMMADTVNLMNRWDDVEYTKGKTFNWVPFPKATTATGRDIAFNYGYTMMLPKKMKNQSNAPYAVKFMELWANRFTEAIFDYFEMTNCLHFTYAQKKEYFEFVVKNTYFGIQMNEWDMVTGDNATQKNQWFKAFNNAQFNITTETQAMKNVVEQALKDCLAYGS